MTIIANQSAISEHVIENGLLAASEADLYECPAQTQVSVTTLIGHNGGGGTNTLYVYTQKSGGTSRLYAQKELATTKRWEMPDDGISLNEGDKIRGYATNANQVTWTLTGVKQTRV